jgi:HlyD family secretion protein
LDLSIGILLQISSTLGVAIDVVQVDQGDEVEANQELIHLRDTVFVYLREQAQSGVKAAGASLKALEEMPTEEDIENGLAMVSISEAELEEAIAAVELLESFYSPQNPPDTEFHAGESAVAIAEAGVNLANAQLDQIMAGPLDGERRMAEALLREAEAQLRLVERQMEDLTLTSPQSGIVYEIFVNEGEIVAPGAPIARILDPTYLTVKVYVPEIQVAVLRIGTSVEVTTDAYPEEVFNGSLLRIADKAQFTPTLVLTEEERVKLVFEVEILIEEGLDKLKPGMPVDVKIQT